MGKHTKSPRIGIVGTDLLRSDEAYANQMRVIAEGLDTSVLTCSDRQGFPLRKEGRYLDVNIGFLVRRVPVLSFLNGFFFYLVLKVFETRFDVLLLSAGTESMFLKFMNLRKCVPIVSTIDDEAKASWFASRVAPRLSKTVVQSNRVRQRLVEMGVPNDKLHFMYPAVDFVRFKATEPPDIAQFHLLFASAPTVENPEEDNFQAKGISLLLEAFHEFVATENATLHVLWRGKYNDRLGRKIQELGLGDKVEVIDREVDMAEWYRKTHVTVVPFTSPWRSPQIPLSALESLVSGRPVVTTDVVELADMVRDHKCGWVSAPTKERLAEAFRECKLRYFELQRNCHRVAEVLGSNENNIGNALRTSGNAGGDRRNGSAAFIR